MILQVFAILLVVLGVWTQQGCAFFTRTASSLHLSTLQMSANIPLQDSSILLSNGFIDMIKYRESCPPTICLEQLVANVVRQVVPSMEVVHWAHPVIMGAATLFLGLAGLKYGIDIKKFRQGRPGVSQLDYAEARRRHPFLMSLLLASMIFGLQSGMASILVLQAPLVESWHAKTAVALTLALVVQAISGNLLASNGQNATNDTIGGDILTNSYRPTADKEVNNSADILRLLHRVCGMGSLSLLLLHIATGILLASSIEL